MLADAFAADTLGCALNGGSVQRAAWFPGFSPLLWSHEHLDLAAEGAGGYVWAIRSGHHRRDSLEPRPLLRRHARPVDQLDVGAA